MSDEESPEMTETATEQAGDLSTGDASAEEIVAEEIVADAPIEEAEVAPAEEIASEEVASEEVATDIDVDVAEDDVAEDDVTADPDVSFDLTDAAAAVNGDGTEVDDDSTIADDSATDVEVDDPWTRPGSWYVVHTQSGYEKKVTANLHARIQSMNMAARRCSARSFRATCSCGA
jgi:transcriptional antiterminator NusG